MFFDTVSERVECYASVKQVPKHVERLLVDLREPAATISGAN